MEMDFSAFLNVLKPFEKLIGAVAPTVATALGGPLAGNAVGFLMKALDIDTPEAMAEKLQTQAPDTMLALRQIEVDYQKHLDQLGLDLERIAAGDRDSARKMQSTTPSKLVPALALFIVASFVGVVVSVLMGLSHIESVMAGTLIGYLSSKADQVISYYFGSSAGSAAKNSMIDRLSGAK
jgi:hypothetical protein